MMVSTMMRHRLTVAGGWLLLWVCLVASPIHAADVIGPSFPSELQAAGLMGLPFSWVPDGTIQYGPTITQTQRTAIEAVKAAHNPTTPVTNVPGFKAWLDANLTFDLRNKVEKAYPGFMRNLAEQKWADFQAGCILARADVPLTAGQWTALKNAVTTYKIPVTLP